MPDLSAIQDFVEQMGLEAEFDGLPRISGRLMALLLLSQTPTSLEDMAETLQVSRASVSTNCRLLEQMGFALRVSLPGDRRDYYRISPNFPERILAMVQERLSRKHQLAAATLETLPEEVASGRERVRVWRDFHAFMLEEIQGVLSRWHALQEGQSTDSPSCPEPQDHAS
jgi:DNA-binding transcriptional regulator GbsR (MarR family)